MFTRVWFLYSIHYANSKICGYKISREEIVSPLDRDGNSSALSFLSKLVRAARVLLTVLRNEHNAKTFGNALSCRVVGQNFISIIYSSLVQFHVQIVIKHSIKLSFLTSHANATKVNQT